MSTGERVKKAKRQREASDMGAMVQRVLASLAMRAKNGDTEAVEVLAHLGRAVDFWLDQAVANLRAEPWSYSWTDIGNALGVTKQAAQQRFGGLSDERCDKCGGLVRLHKRECRR